MARLIDTQKSTTGRGTTTVNLYVDEGVKTASQEVTFNGSTTDIAITYELEDGYE